MKKFNKTFCSRLLLQGVALLAMPLAAIGAQQPVRALARPEAEFSEPFSQLVGVRELKNGRVVAADFKDKTVQLIDFKTGTASKIGREGSGPGEFNVPLGVYALPGDTSMIYDPLNQRFLAITPDGKPGATFRLEVAAPPKPAQPAGGTEQRVVIGGSALGNPRYTDSRGRVYFEGSPIVFTNGVPASADSAAVVRFDRTTQKAETLAFVQLAKNDSKVKTTGTATNRNVNVQVGSNAPFPARDEWAVLPDGRVAIARVANYRIDIVESLKKKTSGAPVEFVPIKVGDAEKAEWREQAKRSTGIAMTRTVGGPGGGSSSSGTTALPPPEEPAVWPAAKPAFVGRSVFATPTGETWVLRARKAADKVPAFDVFDTTGKLTGKVTLQPKSRLVGFGDGTVYVARSDEDDLQYLMRYRIAPARADSKVATPIPLTKKPG